MRFVFFCLKVANCVICGYITFNPDRTDEMIMMIMMIAIIILMMIVSVTFTVIVIILEC